MAGRTNSERIDANTEAIRKLETSAATLRERVKSLHGEIMNLAREFDGARAGARHMQDNLNAFRERIAVAEERLRQAEDRLAREESQRRQMSLLFLGAFVSFLASPAILVLNLVRD